MAPIYIAYTDSDSDTFNSPTFSAYRNKYAVVMLAYYTSDGASLPANISIGGNTMTKAVDVNASGTEVDATIGIYYYPVPDSWNSTAKTVDVSGGTHASHHRAACVELAGVSGVGQTATDTNDEDVTITGCDDNSLLLNMIASDGAATPALSAGGVLIAANNHDDGDNRYDRGWGWAYGYPSNGSNTFDWTANDRCIAAAEFKSSIMTTATVVF